MDILKNVAIFGLLALAIISVAAAFALPQL